MKLHIYKLVLRRGNNEKNLIDLYHIDITHLSAIDVHNLPWRLRKNNPNNNNSNLGIKSMIPKFLQSLRKDISGHYSNPTSGIDDVAFPGGWHGRAIETEFGLLVNMHPGNESQYLRNLLNKVNPVINPVILGQSLNNSVINK